MATSSDVIDVKLPEKWEELNDKQLLYVCDLMAAELPYDAIKAWCFFRWSGLPQRSNLDPMTVAEALEALDWMGEPPLHPVRASKLNGHEALAADFDGVALEKFIVCDNLYQGYIRMKQPEFLLQMAKVLYQTDEIKLTSGNNFMIMLWFSSLKGWLSKRFPYFFHPATSGSSGSLREAVDSMIRALTKGDITKEREILSFDTLRALTELNAQAREAEEIKRQLKK